MFISKKMPEDRVMIYSTIDALSRTKLFVFGRAPYGFDTIVIIEKSGRLEKSIPAE